MIIRYVECRACKTMGQARATEHGDFFTLPVLFCMNCMTEAETIAIRKKDTGYVVPDERNFCNG